MCIEFDDPISKGKGYACVDGSYTDLINPFDELNSQVSGYFFVTNVGYNNLLYFPEKASSTKVTTDLIYQRDISQKLNEKIYFHKKKKKKFSSNYIE